MQHRGHGCSAEGTWNSFATNVRYLACAPGVGENILCVFLASAPGVGENILGVFLAKNAFATNVRYRLPYRRRRQPREGSGGAGAPPSFRYSFLANESS